MQNHTVADHGSSASLDDISQLLVKWIGKSNVADDTALVECKGTDTLGAVNDLVGEDKVHGLNVLLQGADGGEGDNAADANAAEGGNVGPVGHLVRRKLVMKAVAGEEGNVDVAVGEDVDGRGGLAPRRVGVQSGDGRVALELAEASAANDGDVDGLCRGGRGR